MSRILHLSARREQLEVSYRQFWEFNMHGVRTMNAAQPNAVMNNGDVHVWMIFGNGDSLRGTEWDCVIVDEDIRRFMAEQDYVNMLVIAQSRVRPN